MTRPPLVRLRSKQHRRGGRQGCGTTRCRCGVGRPRWQRV